MIRYGGLAWCEAVDWSGRDLFHASNFTNWTVPSSDSLSRVAGVYRTGGGLTFVRVFDSGHLVPMNQPLAALHLLHNIMHNPAFTPSSSTANHDSSSGRNWLLWACIGGGVLLVLLAIVGVSCHRRHKHKHHQSHLQESIQSSEFDYKQAPEL